MSQMDSPASEQEQPSVEQDGVPDILSRVMHVAAGLIQHVRHDQNLRNEIVQLLREFERAITPTESSEANSTIVTPAENVGTNESVPDQTPVPYTPDPESVQPASPETPPVIVNASTLRDLETAMASVNAFIGRESASQAVRPTVGLNDIARSFRLKSEACEWAVERRRLIAGGADFRLEVAPRDRELIEKARAVPECFLWMAAPTAPMPEPMELYADLAERYEDAAAATDLLAELTQQNDERETFELAMALGAEAQSALRESVAAVGFRTDEPSQLDLFHWLRRTAQEQEIYISRYLRMADKPSPSEIRTLGPRIEEQQAVHRARVAARKTTTNALKKIRYHLSQLNAGQDDNYHWGRIFDTIGEVVPEFLRANDIQLREVLVRHIDEIPGNFIVPERGQEVLEAIDRFLASRPDADRAGQQPLVQSPEMAVLRKRFKDKIMVVVGGEARPYAKEALREAFDLREISWIATREHGSTEFFQPYIRVSDVAIVLLAIRWSSHSFGIVRDYCEAANVPFVRLPGGYNPSQVAHQIAEQIPALVAEEASPDDGRSSRTH